MSAADFALLGAWAWLFCGPLTEADMIFSWLPPLVRKVLNGWKTGPLGWKTWIYLPLIGCGKCHAFWIALAVHFWKNGAAWPEWQNMVIAVSVAAILAKWLK